MTTMEVSKATIQQQLFQDSQAFISWANELSDEQLNEQLNGKWSVAEVTQHLFLSARPVARLLAGPRDVLNQWGRADKPQRSFDQIVADYQAVLQTGAKAPAAMSPRSEDVQVDRDQLVKRFTDVYEDLVHALKTWQDEELDTYCIPHPVLGKLTVREMVYFTSAHTQHHLRLLQQERS